MRLPTRQDGVENRGKVPHLARLPRHTRSHPRTQRSRSRHIVIYKKQMLTVS